jgi:hypothetical protein
MASILKLDTLQTPSGTGVITSPNTIVSPGAIVQVVTATTTANGSTTSNGTPSPTLGLQLFNQSFTPKLSNSIILVQTSTISIHEESNASNNCWLGAWYDSTQIGVNSATINYTSFSGALQGGYFSLNHAISSWGTSTKNINIRAGMDAGTSYVNVNSYSNFAPSLKQVGLTIMEIAP